MRGVSELDLCCGVGGPGRFITQELGCTYLGVDFSSSAVDIARERAGDLPCRFEVSQIPADPSRPVRRGAPVRDDPRLPEKEALLQEISQALTTGGRFAFAFEEGPSLTEADRERMPDADTVWRPNPLREVLTCLAWVGRSSAVWMLQVQSSGRPAWRQALIVRPTWPCSVAVMPSTGARRRDCGRRRRFRTLGPCGEELVFEPVGAEAARAVRRSAGTIPLKAADLG